MKPVGQLMDGRGIMAGNKIYYRHVSRAQGYRLNKAKFDY